MSKKKYSLLLSMILLMVSVKAQDISAISSQLNTVETGKYSYRQELKPMAGILVQFIVVQVDSKGKESESMYEFSFADIDKNTVRSLTKKDVILVQLLVGGKQKLIKKTTNNGDKISYANTLQFYATNAENGTQLAKSIKECIPEAQKKENSRLSLKGYQDHINWLVENLGDIDLPKKQIVQKASTTDMAGKLILEQTFATKNKSENQKREFNLAILNPNSIRYQITGEEFTISVDTRRSINGIKLFVDGKQKNYSKNIKFQATSITNGKDISKVLKKSIPLAIEAFEKQHPQDFTKQTALAFLNKVISNVSASESTLTQNLSLSENVALLKQTETTPINSTDLEFHLNFADINGNNIDYDGQKDLLFITLPTKKSVNFIKKIKDGELQNYTKECKIYLNSIEDAILATKALKQLNTLQEQKMKSNTTQISNLKQAVDKLNQLLQKVNIGEDNYDLFVEITDEATRSIKLTSTFSNLKKSVETVQEFSLNDINPKNCSIKVKGKHVIAALNTQHLEKIVKTYVDGQIKPYQYKVGIEAKGIEAAREIVTIVQSIAANN